RSLPAPVVMIGDKSTPGEFRLSSIRIEQPPMSAYGALELALPGLVVCLDEVDAIIPASGVVDHLVHGARLIHRRWQCAFTHATGARPAEFADEHVLARKGSDHLRVNGIDMRAGMACGNRESLPIRQDMDGDEIDRAGHVAVAQPELPDIGVADRHANLCLDLADGPYEVRRRHLSS